MSNVTQEFHDIHSQQIIHVGVSWSFFVTKFFSYCLAQIYNHALKIYYCILNVDNLLLVSIHHHHHQPINVPTAGAQAFLMDHPQGEVLVLVEINELVINMEV
jgi:hypothetical protein